MATVHIAAAVIGWKRSGNKGKGKLSLGPNLLLNWISCLEKKKKKKLIVRNETEKIRKQKCIYI
jgi:hypothetical protein